MMMNFDQPSTTDTSSGSNSRNRETRRALSTRYRSTPGHAKDIRQLGKAADLPVGPYAGVVGGGVAIQPYAEHTVLVCPLDITRKGIADVGHVMRRIAEFRECVLEDARVRFGKSAIVGEYDEVKNVVEAHGLRRVVSV